MSSYGSLRTGILAAASYLITLEMLESIARKLARTLAKACKSILLDAPRTDPDEIVKSGLMADFGVPLALPEI